MDPRYHPHPTSLPVAITELEAEVATAPDPAAAQAELDRLLLIQEQVVVLAELERVKAEQALWNSPSHLAEIEAAWAVLEGLGVERQRRDVR